ncbi:PH domain-containing protein [Georgenia wangjunii]|uniref:PH domain-containing protein n=1 Tax=Georgenia wangjunii TaxID=3117730 RepID=UPI002F263D0A
MTVPPELYAPFRPRAARVVSLVLILLTLLGAAAIIVFMPGLENVAFEIGDQIGTAATALLICWFCYRQYSVAAVPDENGLTVRNLILSRRLAWAEIISVRFGDGRPWVQLDLADGGTLAVMGIQSADGARAAQQARRLATLVAVHEGRDTSS